MARPNNQIVVHKDLFREQAKKIKESINDITKKDSLSNEDTQAIRILTEVYDVLANPEEENREKYQVDCSSVCQSTFQ